MTERSPVERMILDANPRLDVEELDRLRRGRSLLRRTWSRRARYRLAMPLTRQHGATRPRTRRRTPGQHTSRT
jgi:hypothetical protein